MRTKLKITNDDYLLRGLPRKIAIRVLQIYRDGDFCKECLKSGKKLPGIRNRNFLYVTEITCKDETYYCEYGHEVEIREIPQRIRNKKQPNLGSKESKKSYTDMMKSTKSNLEIKLI